MAGEESDHVFLFCRQNGKKTLKITDEMPENFVVEWLNNILVEDVTSEWYYIIHYVRVGRGIPDSANLRSEVEAA